jgi:hypothetical protein
MAEVRVAELDDEEVLQFIERNKAANTVRKTRSDLNNWSCCIPHTKFTMRISSIK